MGKIFSWNEIQKGHVPDVATFSQAKGFVHHEMQSLFDAHLIKGARTVGSVARGEPTRRSDYDLLVAIAPFMEPEASLAISFIEKETALRFFVIPEFMQGAPADNITMELFAREPLEGNVIGEDPLSFWRPSEENTPADIVSSAFEKNREYLSPDAAIATSDFLKQIPMKVALKTPQFIGVYLAAARKVLYGEPIPSNTDVVLLLRERISDASGRNAIDYLLETDAKYNTLLERAVAGDCSEDEYRKFVFRASETSVTKAYEVFTLVEPRLDVLLDMPRSTREGQIGSVHQPYITRR